MSRLPQIAIIIVNWNGRDDTLACLASLRNLTYPHTSVVLVDNGSTDDSVATVRRQFPRITILEAKRNLLFAGGNNKGITHAKEHGADHVMLLNNDTIATPDLVTRLVDRLESDSRIGMVAPKIYYDSDPRRIWFAGARIRPWLGTMSHRGIREVDHGQFDEAKETDYATGCCVLVRGEVIDRIGLLDEAYRMYGEDADWSVRARKAGYRILFEPAATLRHKVSASAGGNLSLFKLRNKLVSQIRFFSRHAAWYHWLVIPWMSILINLYLLFSRSLQHSHVRRSGIHGEK